MKLREENPSRKKLFLLQKVIVIFSVLLITSFVVYRDIKGLVPRWKLLTMSISKVIFILWRSLKYKYSMKIKISQSEVEFLLSSKNFLFKRTLSNPSFASQYVLYKKELILKQVPNLWKIFLRGFTFRAWCKKMIHVKV